MDEAEAVVVPHVVEICRPAGNEIIDADHFVAFGQKPIAQVRAQKSSSAGYQGALTIHDYFLIFLAEVSSPFTGATGVPACRPTL